MILHDIQVTSALSDNNQVIPFFQKLGARNYPAGYRTPFAVESPFCNTVSPGGSGPKHFLTIV
jgi:hypothetical protein